MNAFSCSPGLVGLAHSGSQLAYEARIDAVAYLALDYYQ